MNKRRLLKLARHLEKGKLGHKKFSMNDWSFGLRQKNRCGTAGCALGECLVVFPTLWEVNKPYSDTSFFEPIFGGENLPLESAMKFFDLCSDDCLRIFMPKSYCNRHGCECRTVTRYMVAKRIREVVANG